MVMEDERSRYGRYLLVALAAFFAGMALGQLAATRGIGGSRIHWPAPAVPHPRSLQP
jgi:hypothetical protein